MTDPTAKEQETIVSISDPRVLAIPIRENGDPLVEIAYLGLIVAYATGERDPGDLQTFSRLRKGVVEKLLAAQRFLPEGVKLLIKEGYRPLSLQRQYFEQYQQELFIKYPLLTEEELYAKTCLYVAPPDSAPPHTTGGAVDLTLMEDDGCELDMGTQVNDTPEASEGRCFTHSPNISPVARENRRLLIRAMGAAGFVNYPSEWWHWSYGDRYWAFHKWHPYALYGSL